MIFIIPVKTERCDVRLNGFVLHQSSSFLKELNGTLLSHQGIDNLKMMNW